MLRGVISLANKDFVMGAVQAVAQRRIADRQQSTQRAQDFMQQKTLASAKTPAGSKVKPTSNGGAKAKTSGAKPAGAPGAAPSITPYLNASDMLGVSQATSAAEGADSAARFGLTTAAANSVRARGDIERSRVKNVTSVNDNAAARGIYDSGIRMGGTGMANADAARGQQENDTNLAMAAAQSIAQRRAAAGGLSDYMSAMASKAAENGAALPVDPRAGAAAAVRQRKSPSQNGATNVKGAATMRKRKPGLTASRIGAS